MENENYKKVKVMGILHTSGREKYYLLRPFPINGDWETKYPMLRFSCVSMNYAYHVEDGEQYVETTAHDVVLPINSDWHIRYQIDKEIWILKSEVESPNETEVVYEFDPDPPSTPQWFYDELLPEEAILKIMGDQSHE